MSSEVPDPCPLCNGTLTQRLPDEAGFMVGRQCPCVTVDRLSVLRERIPERYRGVTLKTLTARTDLHQDQAAIIEFMRAHPTRNYYLCGANDTGKSHFLWALCDHALVSGRNVVASSMFDWVRANQSAIATGKFIDLSGMFRQSKHPYSAFFDDIDKARPTEYVAEIFFNMVDAIYSNKHQLVVTSQLEPERLIEHFERADPRYGVGIARRIVNDETAVWRMF